MEPLDVDVYARSAAHLTGLSVDDAWWPGVRRHLATLLDHAALLETNDINSATTVATVFEP